ncbi:hypothetical protein Tco_0468716 [Tanacetum coccineum]
MRSDPLTPVPEWPSDLAKAWRATILLARMSSLALSSILSFSGLTDARNTSGLRVVFLELVSLGGSWVLAAAVVDSLPNLTSRLGVWFMKNGGGHNDMEYVNDRWDGAVRSICLMAALVLRSGYVHWYMVLRTTREYVVACPTTVRQLSSIRISDGILL